MLLCAEQIAGTADLKITHRDLEPAAQIRKLTDRSQTLFSDFL